MVLGGNNVKNDKKTIVLDKSYLRGKTNDEVAALCRNNDVLMIDTLFMELISAEAKDRTQCFNKLPKEANPITLMPSVSNLLQKEIELNKSCTPVTSMRYNVNFMFNPRLCDDTFMLSEGDKVNIAEWNQEIFGELNDFREQCILVEGYFPKLNCIRPGSRSEIIIEIINAIAFDGDMIRDIYGSIRKNHFPTQEIINENWAFFRWMQVHLMAAVDYYVRYGTVNTPRKEALQNEKLDLDYCIIGTLSDGIATMDSGMKKRYRHICPCKTILD